jgi:hypothetical protein
MSCGTLQSFRNWFLSGLNSICYVFGVPSYGPLDLRRVKLDHPLYVVSLGALVTGVRSSRSCTRLEKTRNVRDIALYLPLFTLTA